MIRPEGFRDWIFVGSNLGLGYDPEIAANTAREKARASLGEYHNVYINRDAYESYLQNRTFPNGTVLIMDVFSAQNKEPQGIVTAGSFNGQSLGIEVAVKNDHRPDGVTTDWAYYDFIDRAGGGKQIPADAPAHADSDCYACHKAHASHDNVWVQFYPTLRDIQNPH